MLVVAHNLESMNTVRQFNINSRKSSGIIEKLSSGYRINRAADDAAGLSISEKMRNQIRNLNQAAKNAEDGISLIQTADGAMSEISAILHRGTELCVKAANDTMAPEDREAIQAELNEIIKEIDDVSNRMKFNDRYLLLGSNNELVGEGEPPVIKGGLPSWASMASTGYMSETYKDPSGVDHSGIKIDLSAFTAGDVSACDGTGFYMTCCTCSNHYSIQFNSGNNNSVNTSGDHYIYNVGLKGAKSTSDVINRISAVTGGQPNGHYTEIVEDTDNPGTIWIYDNRPMTSVKASSTRGLAGPGVAHAKSENKETKGDLYLQVGANAGEDMKLQLPGMSANDLGVAVISVASHRQASAGITNMSNAVKRVNAERSRLGAVQNRLGYTINNITNYSENLTNAESLIRDTDMATMMVEHTKNNTLIQVGQAMLAQANQSKQGIISLLQ